MFFFHQINLWGFIMRKYRDSLLRLFFILFIMCTTSIVFVQNSFSQTDTVDIIKEIHAAELRVRDHIDDKIQDIESNNKNSFKDVTDKFANLKSGIDVNASKIDGLSDRFKSLDSRVNTILIAIFSFGGLFVIFILGLITTPLWWHKWLNILNSTQKDAEQAVQSEETARTFSGETQPDIRYTQEGASHEG